MSTLCSAIRSGPRSRGVTCTTAAMSSITSCAGRLALCSANSGPRSCGDLHSFHDVLLQLRNGHVCDLLLRAITPGLLWYERHHIHDFLLHVKNAPVQRICSYKTSSSCEMVCATSSILRARRPTCTLAGWPCSPQEFLVKLENRHVYGLFDWQLNLLHDRDIHNLLHDSLVHTRSRSTSGLKTSPARIASSSARNANALLSFAGDFDDIEMPSKTHAEEETTFA